MLFDSGVKDVWMEIYRFEFACSNALNVSMYRPASAALLLEGFGWSNLQANITV
jgi:hypothetical protein